jgi:hypothetical protein
MSVTITCITARGLSTTQLQYHWESWSRHEKPRVLVSTSRKCGERAGERSRSRSRRVKVDVPPFVFSRNTLPRAAWVRIFPPLGLALGKYQRTPFRALLGECRRDDCCSRHRWTLPQACSSSTVIGTHLDPHNDTNCPSDGSIEAASPMSDLAVKSTPEVRSDLRPGRTT